MNSLIFPNGCLPSVEVIARNVARRSDFRMVDLEDITPHYAETLRRWRANVDAHADRIRVARLRRALPAAVAAVPELLRGGLHRAPDRQRAGRARQAALARAPGDRRGRPPRRPWWRAHEARSRWPCSASASPTARRCWSRPRRSSSPGSARPATPREVALRGLGAREIGIHGAGIAAVLSGADVRPWLAVSIAGDLSDIAATAAGPRRAAVGLGAEDGGRRGRLGRADRAGARAFVSKPPLVLLHALGTDRHMWDPVLAAAGGRARGDRARPAGLRRRAAAERRAPVTPRELAEAIAREYSGRARGGQLARRLGGAGDGAGGPRAVGHGDRARRPVGAAAAAEALPRAARRARAAARAAACCCGARAGGAPRSAGRSRTRSGCPTTRRCGLVRAYANAPGFDAVNDGMRANVFGGLGEIAVPLTLAWPEHDRLVARPRDVPASAQRVRPARVRAHADLRRPAAGRRRPARGLEVRLTPLHEVAGRDVASLATPLLTHLNIAAS